MDNPITMDDLGGPPLFSETPMFSDGVLLWGRVACPRALIPIVDLQVPAKPVAEKKIHQLETPKTSNPVA